MQNNKMGMTKSHEKGEPGIERTRGAPPFIGIRLRKWRKKRALNSLGRLENNIYHYAEDPDDSGSGGFSRWWKNLKRRRLLRKLDSLERELHLLFNSGT